MSWHNAPPLNKLTASQLGGKRGSQLWGVDVKGMLYTTYQITPGGGWSDWRGPAWNERKGPDQIYELAAAQLEDQRTQLFVLDMKRQLWTISQATTKGDWNKWEGPNWNKPPGTGVLTKITAARLHGKTYLWGIMDNGALIYCQMLLPSGVTPWRDWQKTKDGLPWHEVTACEQGNGLGAFWGIDNKLQLWYMGQTGNGSWPNAWVGPNWKEAPKVRNIAAVEMKNQKGACIWAITDDYQMICNEQAAPGGDYWFGWTQGDFENKLRGYEITSAVQNNTLGRVWVISNDGMLTSMGVQLSSPVDWERYWTPPAK
jgi:hypothetical protein